MKKFLSVLVLICAAILPSPAQDMFDNADNHPYLGIRAGLDLTCPGKWNYSDTFKNGAGFDLGAIYNIPLWKNLYFEPGLMLYYSNMGSDITITSDSGPGQEANIGIRRFGFRVPFRFGYRFDFDAEYLSSISFFTGPQLEFGLWGKEHAKLDPGISYSESCFKDTFHRTNIGWEFGVDFTAGRFVFEIAGTAGMLNLTKHGKYHQGNVQFNIGYNF
ncbi:MAG: PorT family protein [Bacteroidales bacterium]|nr:PorT family protein [Bacteroidales bacterium]